MSRKLANSHVHVGALIAAALLLKALVPAGWMPVFDNGNVMLRLCGGWAPAPAKDPAIQSHLAMTMDHEVTASPAHHDQDDEERQSSDQPCSFAAGALSWTAPDALPAAVLSLLRTAIVAAFPSTLAPGRGLAAPPPPSTGPPSLS